MTDAEQEEVAEFEQLHTEIARRIKRVESAGAGFDVKQELAKNLYPLLQNLVGAVNTRLLATEDQVIGLLEETDSVLQYVDAAQLAALIGVGVQLCAAFREKGQSAEAIAALVEQYEAGAPGALQLLDEVTVADSVPATEQTLAGIEEAEVVEDGEDEEDEDDDE